jgi:hypothetical protein
MLIRYHRNPWYDHKPIDLRSQETRIPGVKEAIMMVELKAWEVSSDIDNWGLRSIKLANTSLLHYYLACPEDPTAVVQADG